MFILKILRNCLRILNWDDYMMRCVLLKKKNKDICFLVVQKGKFKHMRKQSAAASLLFLLLRWDLPTDQKEICVHKIRVRRN